MLGPIFQREFLTLPRNSQHYVARAVYLGSLWILAMTAWQAIIGWERSATLGDTARFSLLLFQILTVVQVVIVMFFSALIAASNITTEKDRRTFILLLMTDLRNYEIVVGKLMGSLLQIFLLLAGTLPLFMLLLFLGGVAADQVIQSVMIMAATALAAGSLGTLVALWRDKTFQALALTVLFIVLYISIVSALPLLAGFLRQIGITGVTQESLQALQFRLEPIHALFSVLGYTPEAASAFPTAYGFALYMLGVSLLLNLWGIWKLRVWNPSGEPVMQRERPEEDVEVDRAKAHAAPGPVRRVWANPILWREIATRAYGRRPLIVKTAYIIVLALVCFYALAPIITEEWQSPWAAANGLVPVAILSLLLVTAQAVTAITSERDTGALDLLLVTDLTSKEFIFGKLLGIAYNTKEFLIPPIALAVFYALWGYLATPPLLGRNLEAGAFAILGIGVLLVFAMVLGVHVALRTSISRLAIIHGLGTVFFLSVGTLICIALILINGRFEYQWASFIFFLGAGVGGLWWVLSGDRPSSALNFASFFCPLAVFYTVTNILIGKPATGESSDPLLPFLVIATAFGFAVAAMLVPMLSEFDVAMGRTTGEAE